MKTYHAAVGLLATFTFVSCQTSETYPTSTTTIEQLAEGYESEIAPLGDVKVKCSVFNRTETIQLPDFTVRNGESESVTYLLEGISPSAYELPTIGGTPGTDFGKFSVTSAHPKDFQTVNLGWTFEASISEKNGYAIASGTLTERRFGDYLRAQGVPFRPITVPTEDALGREVPVLLTENKAHFPTVHTTEYPLTVAFKPGTSETFRIPLDKEKGRYVDFTITPDA